MKHTRLIMGMPITIELVHDFIFPTIFDTAFTYLQQVDEKFSTYKTTSEVSRINRHEIQLQNCSQEMQEVLTLCEKTKKETNGYFNAVKAGYFDPSGIVKGWAIFNVATLLQKNGYNNFYVDAGGDIQVSGVSKIDKKWKVGIRNPFDTKEIVKILFLTNCGIATSGNYERGEHIYTPQTGKKTADIASITVIADTVLEADRFATAVFAMGKEGIIFLERQKGLEGYMIDKQGIATQTSGFEKFVQ